MTQTAAICQSLLNGDVLSIMNGFRLFSCTNLPRELSRSIEKKFGVEISRDKVVFKSKYGQPGFYYRYRLNQNEINAAGILKMTEYIQKNSVPKRQQEDDCHATEKFKQQNLFQ